MRVVFDTNIFISALVIPGSLAEKALSRIIEGRDGLVLSKDIIKEVLSVLSLKFGREREALSHVAVVLLDLGELVRPDHRLRVLSDEPDNRILECAVFLLFLYGPSSQFRSSGTIVPSSLVLFLFPLPSSFFPLCLPSSRRPSFRSSSLFRLPSSLFSVPVRFEFVKLPSS